MKSTYSFPSASQTREPWPRSRNTGPGEKTAAPREGELTPSTRDRWERSNQCCEFLRVGINNYPGPSSRSDVELRKRCGASLRQADEGVRPYIVCGASLLYRRRLLPELLRS